MTTYDLTLDIASAQVQGLLCAKYGDTARAIRFRFRSEGTPWALPEDAQAVFTAVKADGKVLYNACQRENDSFVYPFTPQTSSCPGLMRCELRLFQGERLLTSPRFDIQVDDTLYHEGDALDSTSEATALRSVADDMQLLMDEISESFRSGGLTGPAGADGQPGADGLTPHIGENGNWYLGEEDTLVSARGEKKWELLAKFSLTEAEACRVVAISQDLNGNSFRCSDLALLISTSAPTDRKGTAFGGAVSVNGTGSYNGGAMKQTITAINNSSVALMTNCIVYRLCGCAYNMTTASKTATYSATGAADLHEIELACSGGEANSVYGEFELWGVRV